MELLLALLLVGATAQREGDVLQLQACRGVPEERFQQHHHVLPDGRNWTSIRPAGKASLCVSVCPNCDAAQSGGYGRLQLQQCSNGSNAQAWSLVPAAQPNTFSVQTARAFVQSQKCTVWNICPADTSSARPFKPNDTMIPYPQCDSAGAWNEDLEMDGGRFKPSDAAHNQAGVCVAVSPPPPPPHKPPGWSEIPIPTPAQLAWSRHEITAIGHFLPLCGHGDMQNASSWASRGCGAPFAADCLPAADFDPKGVDTDGWVKAVAAMGAKVAVFVVRHGCGFDLWPTNASLPSGFKYDYSIANAAYKGGKGDLAAEFVASCKKYNVYVTFSICVRCYSRNLTSIRLPTEPRASTQRWQIMRTSTSAATSSPPAPSSRPRRSKTSLCSSSERYGPVTATLGRSGTTSSSLCQPKLIVEWKGLRRFDGGIPDSFACDILALFKQLQPNAVPAPTMLS
eukprot:COSAG04_NODE_957_length_9173_cov_27.835133_2_plen_454_part_00